MKYALITALCLFSLPVMADLTHEDDINQGLRNIAAADMIRKNCDSIQPRMLRAYFYLNSLTQAAKDKGYSDEQIKAYTKDTAQKQRLLDQVANYLQQHGATPGDAASYCTVGRAEIAAKSDIGRLLK
jgi:hypothetical protein